MAGYYTSQGTYKDKLVMLDSELATESYGIAAKKGNFAGRKEIEFHGKPVCFSIIIGYT